MLDILCDFWTWANITPAEYAKIGIDYSTDKVEFNYPRFEELLRYVQMVVFHEELSAEEIDDVLTILALDNEAENILNFLKDNLPESHLNTIVKAGVFHIQPETRWQIAELILHRKPQYFQNYLRMLAEDPSEYVSRRARNCLEQINKTGDSSLS